MSVAAWVLVAVLGGAGAAGRAVVDGWVASRRPTAFPLGILVVNVAGAAALGVMTGAGAGHDALRLAGTGFLGGFTTFSTWMFDVRRLVDARMSRAAMLNVVLPMALGLAAAAAGWALGAWMRGSTRF